MKINKIKIAWFRGASDPVEMELNSKSLVIYGENGAGKSSFVDSIEYIINNGRITHLAHEHSGRRQEKAIVNTHTPGSQKGEIKVTLDDNSEVLVEIQRNGAFSISPDNSEISKWNYRRTVLRQNELADFIAHTKGDKYSALLPLLGLSYLEVAAENLRKLENSIQSQTSLLVKREEIRKIEEKRRLAFGDLDRAGIEKEAKVLFKKYCSEKEVPEDIDDVVLEASSSLNVLIGKLADDQKKYTTQLEISSFEIKKQVEDIRISASKLAEYTVPLIIEKLNVLKTASVFVKKIEGESLIDCPACGQSISPSDFSSHVETEELRLKEASENLELHKSNIGKLCDNLQNLKRACAKDEVKDWKDKCSHIYIDYVESLNIDNVRFACTEEILAEIDEKIIPILESAKLASGTVPSEVRELLTDQEKLKTINEIIKGDALRKYVLKIENLAKFINSIQKIYRERIRSQSSAVIAVISADIARMWGILHPNEKIENVHLYFPENVDKAIEIGLKFYGVDQESPRLTLSEGHRNSLGLCIFLSMVKRDISADCPVFLDDVVVSFDRNHRGMVANLLESEFDGKQIILLTHDREWYIELKHQLSAQNWEFKALMPWESPDIGIRFSSKQYAFDDARFFLSGNPDSAGNTARKIMDTQIAILSEPLKISLPYLHRERNDHRTAHDFLPKIIALSPTSFYIKEDGVNYIPFIAAIDVFKKADRLILAWANRASHSFDLAQNEATELIDTCESALSQFVCSNCGKDVTRLDDKSAKFLQCACGNLKWKY